MYRPPLPPGHALKQNYLIVRLVAEGGASLVYLASRAGNRWIIKEHFDGNFTQRASDAVSIVSKTGQEHIVARIHKRLQEEVARARVLHHHGMVEMLDAFSENGTVYTVMPYYEGATLDAKPCLHHLPNLILLLRPVFDALTYLHEQNLVHRDVKPENIWLLAPRGDERLQGRAILLDTGQVRVNQSEQAISATYVFTPFGAAELRGDVEARMYGPVGEATDVFALAGTIAFSCQPHSCLEDYALRKLPGRDDPINSYAIPGFPHASVVLRRALSFKASDRFATIASFSQALQEAMLLDGSGVQPDVTESPKPIPTEARGNGTGRASGPDNMLLGFGIASLVIAGIIVALLL